MDVYEKLVDLAKRRGYFWPSYEIYGGVAGFYDLGPLGVALKNKIIEKWRRRFVLKHQDMVVEVETPIITPEVVLKASGHLDSFTDPIVECRSCGRKFRADHLVEESTGEPAEQLSAEELSKVIRGSGIRCPACGGELGEVRLFNLLFQTTIGPYKEDRGFLRPETAQGIFVAFKRVYECMRERLPLGIAQVGRVARNEISPRQGMVRLREFTIMEIEFFYDPEDPRYDLILGELNEEIRVLPGSAKLKGSKEPMTIRAKEAVEKGIIVNPWLAYWMVQAKRFLNELGVPDENQFFEEKLPWERAHYSSQTFDQMVKVARWGWIEVSGHAYRTDYDLSRHMEFSGKDLRVFKAFKSPREIEVDKVVVNKAAIGRAFKGEAAKIVEALGKLDPSSVRRELENKGYVEVCGFRVTGEMVKVVKVREKVSGRYFVPHVAEPSFGAERLVYVTLEYSYREKEDRVVLSLPRDVAPVQVAVFPLVAKGGIVEMARRVYRQLVDEGFTAIYDDSGSIGRRYARSDEIGVPAAVTVDYQSLSDRTVTLRDRDTWKQVRVGIGDLVDVLREFVERGKSLEELAERYGLPWVS